MKKIVRMALVFALAGATLMYTGCTKDYSEDIKALDSRVATLENDTTVETLQNELASVKTTIAALQQADTDIKALIAKKADQSDLQALATKVSTLETSLQQLYYTKTEIENLLATAKDAAKNYTDAELVKAYAAISTAKSDLETRITSEVATLNTTISGLQAQVNLCATKAELADVKADLQKVSDDLDAAEDSIAALKSALALIASEIQSLTVVPADVPRLNMSSCYEGVIDGSSDYADYGYYFYTRIYDRDGDLSDNIYGAFTVKVTPAEAASHVTAETATLIAAGTKVAAAPDTLDIVYLKAGAAPGYVDVYFSIPGERLPEGYYSHLSVSLEVEQDLSEDIVESVASPYFTIQPYNESSYLYYGAWSNVENRYADPGEVILNQIKVTEVAEGTTTRQLFKNDEYDWDIRVSGISANEALTIAEAETIFAAEEDFVIAPSDTVLEVYYLGAYIDPSDATALNLLNKAYDIDSTVFTSTSKLTEETFDHAGDLVGYPVEASLAFFNSDGGYYNFIHAKYEIVKDTVRTALAPNPTYVWDYMHWASLDTIERDIVADSAYFFGTASTSIIKKTGYSTVASAVASIIPNADGKKFNAKIQSLDWSSADVEYIFRAQVEKHKVVYVDSFFFKTTKYPAPEVYTFDEIKKTAPISKDTTFAFADAVKAGVNGTEALHLGNLDSTDVQLYKAITAAVAGNVEVDSVYANGVKVSSAAFLNNVSAKIDADQNLVISIKGLNATYDTKYVFYVSAKNVFGHVNYKWVAPVTFNPAEYCLVSDPAYVTGGIANAGGSLQTGVYVLNDIDLSNYFRIGKSEGATTWSSVVKAEIAASNISFKVLDKANATAGIINVPADPASKTVETPVGNEFGFFVDGVNLSWGAALSTAYTARELSVRAYLNYNNAIVDSMDVKITTANPVFNFKVSDIPAIERVAQTAKTIEIEPSLYANGILEGTLVNILKPTAYKGDEYQCEVTYGAAADIKFFLAGAPYTPNASDYSYDPTTGTFTISSECALLTAPLEVRVPVKLRHYLDYNGVQAEKAEAVITIIQK